MQTGILGRLFPITARFYEYTARRGIELTIIQGLGAKATFKTLPTRCKVRSPDVSRSPLYTVYSTTAKLGRVQYLQLIRNVQVLSVFPLLLLRRRWQIVMRRAAETLLGGCQCCRTKGLCSMNEWLTK